MDKIAIDLGQTFFGTGHYLTTLTGVGVLVSQIVGYAINIAGVIMVFLAIYSGYLFITSSGEPQKVAQAQKVLTTAIIGFVLVVAAWGIVKVIEIITGVVILG